MSKNAMCNLLSYKLWILTTLSLTFWMYVAFNVPQNVIADINKGIAGYFQLFPTPSNHHNKINHYQNNLVYHDIFSLIAKNVCHTQPSWFIQY